jgi:hypothetical protein
MGSLMYRGQLPKACRNVTTTTIWAPTNEATNSASSTDAITLAVPFARNRFLPTKSTNSSPTDEFTKMLPTVRYWPFPSYDGIASVLSSMMRMNPGWPVVEEICAVHSSTTRAAGERLTTTHAVRSPDVGFSLRWRPRIVPSAPTTRAGLLRRCLLVENDGRGLNRRNSTVMPYPRPRERSRWS